MTQEQIDGHGIGALLSAEAFWREAVKNCNAEADDGPSSGMCLTCVFCDQNDTPTSSVPGDGKVVHLADCPYLLAQEPQ